ncbi:MAG: hypothetical protein ACYDCK_00655 [Thermoplasmatota archaeon]
MADALQYIVRFLHIFFAVAWLGGAVFFLHASGRLRRAAQPLGNQALLLIAGGTTQYFIPVSILAVVFGFWNQVLIVGGFSALSYTSTRWDTLIGIALVLAIINILDGAFVITPTVKKMQALAAKMPRPAPGAAPPPPNPEMEALGKKVGMSAALGTALIFIVLILMVTATLTRIG